LLIGTPNGVFSPAPLSSGVQLRLPRQIAGLCADTLDDRIVFFFQLSVSPLRFHQSAALFLQALFEITNLFLEAKRHPRHRWSNGIAELNFGLVSHNWGIS
jgi:hypothetical protein